MSCIRVLPAVALFCALAGCSSGPSRQSEIGEAFAGPATLKIRKEIDPRSPEVVTVTHGERLGIVGRRRRFVRVRTTKGIEGWTDMRQLLASEQMADLNRLAETAQYLPSQGAATVFEALNVHTQPNRQAPSFYRIKEGELVDVVAHELTPRVPFENKAILPPRAPKPKPEPKKKEEPRVPKVPMPPAPKPPADWLELSKLPVMPPEPEKEEAPPKPVPVDDWSLVRLKNGRAGWVLTGSLKMDIPDEVAQYSEGHRITSYFATGDVHDNGQVRHHWLWTTITSGRVPYEFDSFRYFIWNTRRHRYETAYVERNLKGFFPVEVHPVTVTNAGKTEKFPGFSIIVEENGVRYRKTYSYQVYLVRLVSKEPLDAAVQPGAAAAPALAQSAPASGQNKKETPGFYTRFKKNIAALKTRWFGKK
ncbi:MAG: hypothetical protein ACM336_06900 [Acidobacteriota bacterium]